MDKLLDIHELVQNNKKREIIQLSIFAEILSKCHNSIKKHNLEHKDLKDMYYEIPQYIFGKPKYDAEVLRNYLIYHLRDNGLLVILSAPWTLYISWRETDIDIEKYMKRRQRIDGNMRDMAPLMGITPAKDPFVDTFKTRQERQKELQQNRDNRINTPTRVPVTMSYEQFIKARY
jgi:hypothetical protein